MKMNVHKSYENEWFDEDNEIVCNKQDLQKLRSVEKQAYKSKKERKMRKGR